MKLVRRLLWTLTIWFDSWVESNGRHFGWSHWRLAWDLSARLLGGVKTPGEELRIKVRVQRHLAAGSLAEDSGDFVFFLCRAGLQRMLGERLSKGEDVEIVVRGERVQAGLANAPTRY